MKLGLQGEFDAAHRLPAYDGKCCRVHGHTYRVEVVVEGDVSQESGMILDFYHLKAMLNDSLGELDHRDLNEVLENPTAERIVEHMHSRLKRSIEGTGCRLVSVKLWEGEGKWAMVE